MSGNQDHAKLPDTARFIAVLESIASSAGGLSEEHQAAHDMFRCAIQCIAQALLSHAGNLNIPRQYPPSP